MGPTIRAYLRTRCAGMWGGGPVQILTNQGRQHQARYRLSPKSQKWNRRETVRIDRRQDGGREWEDAGVGVCSVLRRLRAPLVGLRLEGRGRRARAGQAWRLGCAGTAACGGFAEQSKVFAGQMKWDMPVHAGGGSRWRTGQIRVPRRRKAQQGGLGVGRRRRRQDGSTV